MNQPIPPPIRTKVKRLKPYCSFSEVFFLALILHWPYQLYLGYIMPVHKNLYILSIFTYTFNPLQALLLYVIKEHVFSPNSDVEKTLFMTEKKCVFILSRLRAVNLTKLQDSSHQG